MREYRRKRQFVEAEQFFYANTPWPEGVVVLTTATFDRGGPTTDVTLGPAVIQTSFGKQTLADGDWVIKDDEGFALVLNTESFNQIYEPSDTPELDTATVRPWHSLFLVKDLRPNQDYRRGAFPVDGKEDTFLILDYLESLVEAEGEEAILGKHPFLPNYPMDTGSSIMDWYANGSPLPADRKGLLALFHPQIHKRFWSTMLNQAKALAITLKRWVYIVEAEGSRWYMLVLGDDPKKHAEDSPFQAEDQFGACYDPDGKWHMLGCS